MNTFAQIKKNFGFGLMRLPMCGDAVDLAATCRMVDAFLDAGFNYFDTAHPYIGGLSEDAVKSCLSSRYPRERFVLANKLSGSFFEKEEQIRPLFEKQLEKCGVEYFDFYLMHALDAERHATYQRTRAYDIAQELKAEGKIRHVGMSFHDSAEVLDRILTDRPEMEFVQLQINYVDWEDPRVQSRKCAEVCRKHGKPIIVMEPVKGGSLVNLPEKAAARIEGSKAGFAIRFAASVEGVFMVLSGMSTEEQMADNLSVMTDFRPLTPAQQQLAAEVRTIYQAQNRIPCTACRYCIDGCPAGIPISDIFAIVNSRSEENADASARYEALPLHADACIGCGRCEQACPQHLQIRALLQEAGQMF